MPKMVMITARMVVRDDLTTETLCDAVKRVVQREALVDGENVEWVSVTHEEVVGPDYAAEA